jgi:hypothetical protein
MHILKVMSNPPNTIKRREKLQSNGQQQEKAYKQDTHGTDTELSKGADSEWERSTPKGQALERELNVHS